MEDISILIVDDHQLVAEALANILDTEPGFKVLGIANNGWQALNFLEQTAVDIVLTDLNMPLINGLELAAQIQEKKIKTKVVLLTMIEEPELHEEGKKVGIAGYVVKSAEREVMVGVLKVSANRNKYLD